MIFLYTDENVLGGITDGLQSRSVDVLRVQDDGLMGASDPRVLQRATELDRVLFSQDDDLLREAVKRQRKNVAFPGVIYAHQLDVSVGQCIDDLELIAKVCEPEEFANTITYLPLR